MMAAIRAQDSSFISRTIADRTDELLHHLSARPSFDFVTEFAEPLALSAVTAYLGVSVPEPDWFVPASNAISDGMDAGLWPERAAAAAAARARLAKLIAEWYADPPTEGVVGFVIRHARTAREDWALARNTLRVVLHAGYASASKLLSLGAEAILSEPCQLSRWAAADPRVAVEELVRFVSPVQAMARACVVDARLGGAEIRAGHSVTLLLGAANRDPERFKVPETLQLGRRTNPHLGFGRGAHSCLGAPLAVTQAKAVFSALARNYPDAHVVGLPSYRQNLTLRGLNRLTVALR
jgi:hypothetical protein